jgi:hypothetical protein
LRTSRKHWGSEWCAAALGCCLAVPAWGQAPAASLCLAGEAVVFACGVEGKLVSLCRAAHAGGGLQYRFGLPAALELEYPAPGQRAQAAFKVSSLPAIGGGITSVAFGRSGYTYTLYSRVGRADDGATPVFEDGLTVERRGKTLRHVRCEDGGAGFREVLTPPVK